MIEEKKYKDFSNELSYKMLERELEEIEKITFDKLNGWRLVMLFQMPTFSGVYIYSNESITLFALLGLSITTMYLAYLDKIHSDRKTQLYRNKIIRSMPDSEIDYFIKYSYDYRFFSRIFPFTRILSLIQVMWPAISTCLCLLLLSKTL